MDRVVEPALAGYPGDGAPLRVRDPVGELLPGGRLDDVQRRHLVAAPGEPVCDVARVPRWVVPVERHEAVPVERVRVDERSIRRTDSITHVQHTLLLLPLPPRMEDAAGDRPRRREE